MKQDIANRADLYIIVRDFYNYLFQSTDISHFFESFKHEDALQEHLATLVDFWDNTLFYSGAYKKNAMKPHFIIHEEKGLQASDFDEWIFLFKKAVDDNFKGENSETIKSRALSIATVMKLKMNLS